MLDAGFTPFLIADRCPLPSDFYSEFHQSLFTSYLSPGNAGSPSSSVFHQSPFTNLPRRRLGEGGSLISGQWRPWCLAATLELHIVDHGVKGTRAERRIPRSGFVKLS